MATWYSKDLGDGIDAHAPSTRIQEAFTAMCIAGRQPLDFAVFSRYDLRRNVVSVYFSPSAHALASAFSAVACQKPGNEEGFGLLVGDQRACCLQRNAFSNAPANG